VTTIDTSPAPTVKAAPLVYGGQPALDDAAEHFHEASKLYPSFGARQTRGHLLELRADLRHSTARAGKRHYGLPATQLPPPMLPDRSLASVIQTRTSARRFAAAPVPIDALSALLHGGYGVTHQLDPTLPAGTSPLLRAVPSGGALYPLELYVAAYAVGGLATGLYHVDPVRGCLEQLRLAGESELRERIGRTTMYPELAAGGSLLIAIASMFWRSRFKYGLRGYRFALFEAGHVAQNLLLVGTGLGLATVPIGGFFDRRMDELLGLDGVNESMLYAVAVGQPEET
jgi:SagB-type dehydrogenase family enzyme